MRCLFSSVALFLGTIALCISCKKEPQTINLFNGKNLDNWGMVAESGFPAEVFSISDQGNISIKGNPFGYLYTLDTYDNFQLHVEWCYPDSATNSGIFLLVQEPFSVWPNAVECQLCAGKAGDFVLLGGSDLKEFRLEPGQERPAFPVVEKREVSNEKPVGEWNSADITCQNGTITVAINGTVQNEGTSAQHRKGHIALQSEGGSILFRNVRLTPLP